MKAGFVDILDVLDSTKKIFRALDSITLRDGGSIKVYGFRGGMRLRNRAPHPQLRGLCFIDFVLVSTGAYHGLATGLMIME